MRKAHYHTLPGHLRGGGIMEASAPGGVQPGGVCGAATVGRSAATVGQHGRSQHPPIPAQFMQQQQQLEWQQQQQQYRFQQQQQQYHSHAMCDDIVEHSLAALDQVLTVYDDARSVPQPQYGGDLPPPPPELLPTQPPGAGADGAGAGCVKRAAPPLPKRSPDTRLSTSSADGGGPLLAPQQPDNPVVDFYPDCESGPESGYITPADQGSESEYPAINLATQYVREYYPHQVSAHYPPPPQPQKTTPPAAAQPQPPLYAQSPKIIMRSNSVCSASEDYTYDRHIDGVFVPPASSASPPPPPPPAEFQTADLFPPPPMDAAAPQTFPKPSKVAASSSSASSEPHALPFKVSLKPVSSSSSSSSAQSSLPSSSSGGGGSPPSVGSLPPPPPPAPPAVPPPPPVTVAKQPQTIDRSVKPAASSTSGAADDGDAAHAALINQIQSGITLRHSPLAAKIYTSPAPSSGSPDSPEDRAAVSSPGGKVAPPTAPKTKAAPPLGMRVGGQQQQPPPPVDPLAEAPLPPTSPSHQIAAPAGIDVTELPGYTPIPENCPVWKRALLEKKNNQILETAKMELLAKKAEEEKWRDVPAWKKNLILEKEKKKEKEPGVLQAPSESDRRRMEEENRRLESMPDWKRKLVLQKRTD